jgi:hypothetical protein
MALPGILQILFGTVENLKNRRLQTGTPAVGEDAVNLAALQAAIAGIDIPTATAATATADGTAGIVKLAASSNTTALDKAATPAGVAAQVAAKIPSSGAAPLPKTGTGVGHVQTIYNSVSGNYSLITIPAGGTWLYFFIATNFSSVVSRPHIGIVAGGTVIQPDITGAAGGFVYLLAP